MNRSFLAVIVASVSTIIGCKETVWPLTCGSATFSTMAASGTAYTGTATVPYTGGSGVAYTAGAVITSMGVTGLNATLQAGTLATGAGNLTDYGGN